MGHNEAGWIAKRRSSLNGSEAVSTIALIACESSTAVSAFTCVTAITTVSTFSCVTYLRQVLFPLGGKHSAVWGENVVTRLIQPNISFQFLFSNSLPIAPGFTTTEISSKQLLLLTTRRKLLAHSQTLLEIYYILSIGPMDRFRDFFLARSGLRKFACSKKLTRKNLFE